MTHTQGPGIASIPEKVPGTNAGGGLGLRGLREAQKSLCKSKLPREKGWGRPSPTKRKLLESRHCSHLPQGAETEPLVPCWACQKPLLLSHNPETRPSCLQTSASKHTSNLSRSPLGEGCAVWSQQ